MWKQNQVSQTQMFQLLNKFLLYHNKFSYMDDEQVIGAFDIS